MRARPSTLQFDGTSPRANAAAAARHFDTRSELSVALLAALGRRTHRPRRAQPTSVFYDDDDAAAAAF